MNEEGRDDEHHGDGLRVDRSLWIPEAELRWQFTRSGGPGGQHANTSATRAEVRFDVAGSPSLGSRQRRRLLDRLGSEVRAAAEDERSQARNRSLARERLRSKLAEALRVRKRRKPTLPSKAAKRRRVEAKRRRGRIKRQRGRPAPDD